MTNFIPLQDYVQIEKIEKEKKTKGGILIPEQNDEKYLKGIVIEIGTGKFNQYTDKYKKINLSINDTIIYDKNSGIEIALEQKKYVLVQEQNIIAKIKN
jgi:chaperonin GroES